MSDEQHPEVWNWRTIILKKGPENPTYRHVLLTLSCYMNDAGGSCFPSQRRLARDTCLSLRVVNEYLQQARQDGWLEVSKHGYGGQKWKRNEYRARVPDGVLSEDGEGEDEPEEEPPDDESEQVDEVVKLIHHPPEKVLNVLQHLGGKVLTEGKHPPEKVLHEDKHLAAEVLTQDKHPEEEVFTQDKQGDRKVFTQDKRTSSEYSTSSDNNQTSSEEETSSWSVKSISQHPNVSKLPEDVRAKVDEFFKDDLDPLAPAWVRSSEGLKEYAREQDYEDKVQWVEKIDFLNMLPHKFYSKVEYHGQIGADLHFAIWLYYYFHPDITLPQQAVKTLEREVDDVVAWAKTLLKAYEQDWNPRTWKNRLSRYERYVEVGKGYQRPPNINGVYDDCGDPNKPRRMPMWKKRRLMMEKIHEEEL